MASESSEFVVITTTSNQREALDSMAEQLVRQRLAACVQVSGPVTSTYLWQEAVESAVEWLATIKTTAALSAEVVSLVRTQHHYETPEIIVTPITGGDADYLGWLTESTRRTR